LSFVLLRWTAASDRETPCVKMLKQFLRALYLIPYSEVLTGGGEGGGL
jgi:hypothetical protein